MRDAGRPADTPPKYHRVKQRLVEDIMSGRYQAHHRLPSIVALAGRYGVSNITARRVVQELVREGVVYTVPTRGCFVAGRENTPNRLVEPGTGADRIALLTAGWADEFYGPIIQGVLEVCRRNNRILEVYCSEGNCRNENDILNRIECRPVAGVLFMPTTAHYRYTQLIQLAHRRIPTVLVDTGLVHHDLDRVTSTNEEGSRRAVQYLIRLGHRRIVFMAHAADFMTIAERHRGYRRALADHGIHADPRLRQTAHVSADVSLEEEGYRKTIALLDARIRFTAIFAVSGWNVIGAYRALRDRGLRVPQDVSLVTFDDLNAAAGFEVPLTAVRQDTHAMGTTAAELLLRRLSAIGTGSPAIGAAETVLIPTKLVVRKSTGPVRSR
jgi:LacI family transcriptional regulator